MHLSNSRYFTNFLLIKFPLSLYLYFLKNKFKILKIIFYLHLISLCFILIVDLLTLLPPSYRIDHFNCATGIVFLIHNLGVKYRAQGGGREAMACYEGVAIADRHASSSKRCMSWHHVKVLLIFLLNSTLIPNQIK